MKNTKLEKQLALDSRGFDPRFVRAAKKYKLIFIHKHGNLDNVMRGGDLMARATVSHWYKKDLLIVTTPSSIKTGHVFLGVTGDLKLIANAYIEKIENGLIYISGMGTL